LAEKEEFSQQIRYNLVNQIIIMFFFIKIKEEELNIA
jgi:hypothetical protein